VAQSRLRAESGLGSGSDIDNSIAANPMLEDQPLTKRTASVVVADLRTKLAGLVFHL
jgi:hypothetical protein